MDIFLRLHLYIHIAVSLNWLSVMKIQILGIINSQRKGPNRPSGVSGRLGGNSGGLDGPSGGLGGNSGGLDGVSGGLGGNSGGLGGVSGGLGGVSGGLGGVSGGLDGPSGGLDETHCAFQGRRTCSPRRTTSRPP